jgi:hypothetical protein
MRWLVLASEVEHTYRVEDVLRCLSINIGRHPVGLLQRKDGGRLLVLQNEG